MYYLPTSLILIGYFLLTFVYIIKNRNEKIEKKLFGNELLIALLFLMAGILFPFMYRYHSPNLPSKSINFLWLFTSIFFLVELGFLIGIVVYNTIISIKDPNIMAERDYNKYCEEFNKNWKDDLKSEYGRKLLHIFTCAVIFFFWTIGLILDDIGVLTKWGLDNYSFSYFLIITIGYGFVIMFQIADLARLNKFYMLPKWAKRWYMDMKKSELDTFVASTPLVLALSPFIFAPFPIFASVALITTGADGMACIIGKKYGKYKLRKKSDKTWEGFIAGGLATFLIVLIVPMIYYAWFPISLEKIVLMAIIATVLFLLIDAFVRQFSDNILNPILTGFGMWLIFIL